MTQLYIAGVEAVLPQNFSVTVKRENSFFTKSGEYTYDVTLRLDNPVNRQLYGFLQRINKQQQVETSRKALLIADGHVYLRGTEIITRWTNDTVTLQLVSGESELNYFVGQDKKIEELDLGTVGALPNTLDSRNDDYESLYAPGLFPEALYCLPMVRTPGGALLNAYRERFSWDPHEIWHEVTKVTPQPYLLALVEAIITALGYTINTNSLRSTLFAKAFIVNTVRTNNLNEMLPGWTVKDFLAEVEKLTGVVFVTNNTGSTLTCDILLKTTFYTNARQLNLQNVIDAYEAEVQDDDSSETEWNSSDITYDLPDHRYASFMRVSKDALATMQTVDYPNLQDLLASGDNDSVIKRDVSTGRLYIYVHREGTIDNEDYHNTRVSHFFQEINQFASLDREHAESELKLKITPAPLAWLGRYLYEIIDLGTTETYYDVQDSESETPSENNDGDIESQLKDFSKEESSACELYVAFCNDTKASGTIMPIAYTDAYHTIAMESTIRSLGGKGITGTPEGSLRLQDLDTGYYQGGYQIDTRHAFTVECYDPNVIDPRQVYVIRNRRFVCRDVEETITAEGRSKKWKATFFPIVITDTAIGNEWILTHGVWDDGGAWLDDGRWNDDPQ